jgi:hypothetical protein
VFSGTVTELVDRLTTALEALERRFMTGEPPGAPSYPWLTLPFAYLAGAVHERAKDTEQRTFWHAGGSASQYYLNDQRIQAELSALRDHLAHGGFLPEDAQLIVVPTFCCQLVATRESSRGQLEELIATWAAYVRRHERSLAPLLARLGTTTDAFGVAADHADLLPAAVAAVILEALARFNAADRNALPVAHVIGRRHPNYNKYGVAQSSLAGARLIPPDGLGAMTWAQAELLVKTLAHLTLDRRG